MKIPTLAVAGLFCIPVGVKVRENYERLVYDL